MHYKDFKNKAINENSSTITRHFRKMSIPAEAQQT
jgi:hypothetical protein